MILSASFECNYKLLFYKFYYEIVIYFIYLPLPTVPSHILDQIYQFQLRQSFLFSSLLAAGVYF